MAYANIILNQDVDYQGRTPEHHYTIKIFTLNKPVPITVGGLLPRSAFDLFELPLWSEASLDLLKKIDVEDTHIIRLRNYVSDNVYYGVVYPNNMKSDFLLSTPDVFFLGELELSAHDIGVSTDSDVSLNVIVDSAEASDVKVNLDISDGLSVTSYMDAVNQSKLTCSEHTINKTVIMSPLPSSLTLRKSGKGFDNLVVAYDDVFVSDMDSKTLESLNSEGDLISLSKQDAI